MARAGVPAFETLALYYPRTGGLEAAVVAAKFAHQAGAVGWQVPRDAQRAVDSARAAIKQGRITRAWLDAQASAAS